ncbi:hypothetical protein Nepgr_019002 [Nepenthes gracilis]|uniref:protein disulfide-isomerase n=1 Tax=Nepenthes gracilis TaxID=150966 RepID=A0AAD3XUW4_NEPGR|nr:hypothetical protein Nepgr_019002 [Nepenthes gracilis]
MSRRTYRAADPREETWREEFVLTLDQSNFSDTVSKHDFIVVEFYAPWCGHCKKLAPEYENAASLLSIDDPHIALAKVHASDELNKELASDYEVRGFPTLKILRNGGKAVQDYKGPCDADGIVAYLKKQSGLASAEIKSAEDATIIIDEEKVVIVGIFREFSGEEFTNFTALAEKLQSDYEFGHTLDAKLLPRGESSVEQPTVRLIKPFDEHFVDFQDFHLDALEKFVEEASMPIVTVFNKDTSNRPYVVKFFNSPNAKIYMNVQCVPSFAGDKIGEAFRHLKKSLGRQPKYDRGTFQQQLSLPNSSHERLCCRCHCQKALLVQMASSSQLPTFGPVNQNASDTVGTAD